MELNIILVLVLIGINYSRCSHRLKIMEPDKVFFESNTLSKYTLYQQKLTFNEARTVCQGIGGDLATIDSQQALDAILELVDEQYSPRSDFFKDDYWLGLIQDTANDYRWVQDCSTLTWTSNYEIGWDTDKRCLRHHKDHFDGSKEPCKSSHAFICQVLTATPCSYFPTLESSALTNIDTIPCQDQCSTMSSCWGTMHLDADGSCIHLVTSGSGDNSINMTSKFCLQIDLDISSFTPAVLDDRDIPNHSCSNIVPTSSVISISPTPSSTITPASSCLVDTLTVTLTPSPVYTTETVNVTINVTETLTDYVNVTQTATLSVSLTDTVNVTQTLSEAINVTQTMTESITVSVTETIAETINVTQTVTESVTERVSITITAYPSVSNITDDEAEQLAEEIVKNLTVDAKTTSAYLRTLISAEDDRVTSRSMGYLGIVVIIVPLSILILSDLRAIFTEIRSHIKVYKQPPNVQQYPLNASPVTHNYM